VTLSANDQAQVAKLGNALQKIPALNFEHLVAGLIGRLLGVGVAVAKGSFQHGGDAGTAGRQGRRLRIECKKYADTTPLSDRELLGEVDQALDRDIALEAWILVATREVSEQLEDMLFQKALKTGVPIIIIDWKGDGLNSLAALCAFAPDIVGEFSTEAGVVANSLQRLTDDAVDQLRRDLLTWSLGFEAVRTLSQDQLRNIWMSPRSSAAALNQNAAGGATTKRIARPIASASLDAWWSGTATREAPATVLGADGVGKTWGTLAWLINRIDAQPIVLVITSSTATELTSTSEVSIKRFLAARLYTGRGAWSVCSSDQLRRVQY
jgi:hypothetical protein